MFKSVLSFLMCCFTFSVFAQNNLSEQNLVFSDKVEVLLSSNACTQINKTNGLSRKCRATLKKLSAARLKNGARVSVSTLIRKSCLTYNVMRDTVGGALDEPGTLMRFVTPYSDSYYDQFKISCIESSIDAIEWASLNKILEETCETQKDSYNETQSFGYYVSKAKASRNKYLNCLTSSLN